MGHLWPHTHGPWRPSLTDTDLSLYKHKTPILIYEMYVMLVPCSNIILNLNSINCSWRQSVVNWCSLCSVEGKMRNPNKQITITRPLKACLGIVNIGEYITWSLVFSFTETFDLTTTKQVCVGVPSLSLSFHLYWIRIFHVKRCVSVCIHNCVFGSSVGVFYLYLSCQKVCVGVPQ